MPTTAASYNVKTVYAINFSSLSVDQLTISRVIGSFDDEEYTAVY